MPVETARSHARVAATKSATPQAERTQSALAECVTRTVRRYLADMGETPCAEGLYSLVLRELEVAMLREALAFHEGNQSLTAGALGINRATLHKKLAMHGLL
ncbi:MAG: helix-turn-helix domain-containing protein [Rhodanobacter sp.]